MKTITYIIAGLLFLIMMGCSTVSNRIQKHAKDFVNYPLDAQNKIQKGQIEKGFTEKMVYMAKGEPSEVKKEMKAHSENLAWYYTRPQMATPAGAASQPNCESMSSPFGYPNMGPSPNQCVATLMYSPYLIVYFKDGKVSEWNEEID